MSFALIAIPVLVLLIAVPVVVAVYASGRLKRRDDEVKAQAARLADPRHSGGTLRYRVPHGQDPAAVLGALEAQGYAATLADGAQDVLVPCPRGVEEDRELVRAVIAGADLNLEGDPVAGSVVFEDER